MTRLYFRKQNVGILALLLFATISLSSTPSYGGIILVGTVSTNSNDNVTHVNALIASYNSAFASSLPLVSAQIDKLEVNSTNTAWDGGNVSGGQFLNSSQFQFFQLSSGTGAESKNVFDKNGANALQFDPVTFNLGSGFNIQDQAVLGFEYNGPQQFQYYVSKNGNRFSLWSLSGPNALLPVYRDSGNTRGDISDSGLSYAPVGNAVSHISFYSAVPEPTSLVLVGLTVVGWSGFRRRRA